MRSKLRVLGYHRIVDVSDQTAPDPGVVSATPLGFEQQMAHLASRYRVVSLQHVLAAQRGERVLPHNAVLLTFDDACVDFAEVAWPILRRYGFAATVFVPTAFADSRQPSFWWDRLYRAFERTAHQMIDVPGLHAFWLAGAVARRAALRAVQRHVKSLPQREAMALVELLCQRLDVADSGTAPVLSWPELRALAAAGVTLVAHTRGHPALPALDDAEILNEVAGSMADVARETGVAIPAFCYPYGLYDERVVRVLRALGVELAFTCEDGHTRLPTADGLRCPRTMITRRTSPLIFALRLHSAIAYVDRWRHRSA